MYFPDLPWRIRDEVIGMIVKEYPHYGLINKEWLRQAAKWHGKLNIGYEAPVPTPVSLITPYIENAYFNRGFNIDWGLICAYKRIKHVRVELIFQNDKEFDEISGKLLLLPLLESLNILMAGKTVDLSRVLMKNQRQLRLLRVPTLCFDSRTSNFEFSKLRCLHLFGSGGAIVLQDIVKNMPELKQLFVTAHTNLNHSLLPNITELCIQGYSQVVELNLNLFPNLVKLDACNIELVNRGPQNVTIESTYRKSLPGFNSSSSFLFPKIRHLKLSYTGSHQHFLEKLYGSFSILPVLVYLDLKVEQPIDFIKYLPFGFYHFKRLILRGPFILSSYSLNQLSVIIKIRYLELHGCIFEGDPVRPAPFENLRRIVITSDDCYLYQFTMYFNYTNFPKAKSIKINNAG